MVVDVDEEAFTFFLISCYFFLIFPLTRYQSQFMLEFCIHNWQEQNLNRQIRTTKLYSLAWLFCAQSNEYRNNIYLLFISDLLSWCYKLSAVRSEAIISGELWLAFAGVCIEINQSKSSENKIYAKCQTKDTDMNGAQWTNKRRVLAIHLFWKVKYEYVCVKRKNINICNAVKVRV